MISLSLLISCLISLFGFGFSILSSKKIANNKILDRKKKVVGSFESVKDKYVFFKNAGLMKKSDLLLSILENFGVQWIGFS